MSTNSVSSSYTSSTASSSSSSSSDQQTIAGNFDTFLTLLTTQLQHQNPLDPLDANQFTAQLVQFASVEQQIKTNQTLDSLVALTRTAQATAAMSLVGATVTAKGADAQLANGKAEWTFSAPRAGVAAISILDAKGNTVFAQERAMTAGANTVTWDGRSSTGAAMPAGVYTLSVAGRDASNQRINVTSEVSGQVTGIDVSGATPMLDLGDVKIPLDQVTAVRRT